MSGYASRNIRPLTPPSVGATRARPARATDAALVEAARAGDRDALDTLVRAHLPLVYHLVRQALGDHPDVDDVVQDVVVRALRQLPRLRGPASFRPWLAAIAMHQVAAHLARSGRAARRTTTLDEAAWRPDAAAELEGPALLRVEVAAQRRQVRHAARWLSADERALLSLWWLETAGELTRTDLAAALGTHGTHAAVRLQRMREQLELSRSIVAALEAMPGCDDLATATAAWNGVPSPFWRKRIARHVRSCEVCARASAGMVPAGRLFTGTVLLPVPAAVSAAAGRAVAAGASAGRLLGLLRAHWWAAATAAGVALVVAIAVAVDGPSALPPAPGPAIAAPPAPLPHTGRVTLEAAGSRGTAGGRFVAIAGDLGVLGARTTFQAVPGVADPSCVTFRTSDGRRLRHASWRLRASPDEGTVLARGDATFCVRDAWWSPGTVALESFNYRGYYLRHTGGELWVAKSDGTVSFGEDASFVVTTY
jgi:RNA polymerase sigma factor (sigma-70 family)